MPKKSDEIKKKTPAKKAAASKVTKKAEKKPVKVAKTSAKKTEGKEPKSKKVAAAPKTLKQKSEPKAKVAEIKAKPVVKEIKLAPKPQAVKPASQAVKPVEQAKSVQEEGPHVDITEEILGGTEKPLEEAELYDELIAQELDRELIRSQRKQMAGKDAGGKKPAKKFEPQVLRPLSDRTIEIAEVISVKEFAEKTGFGAAKIIGELMKNGILANINQQIDYDTAQIISDDLGIKIKKKRTEASAEDVFSGNIKGMLKEDDPADLQQRPPIVVVMGHVDHGKTTLLDAIRETNVVAGESGGITQHIGAYQVVKNSRKITFLDTPGHEAFTAMRARGAKVTDIAILVVAADEGIKPQTEEAIHHAQDAEVPIIVAINKIDKPGAAPERVKGELGQFGLVPEEWGGKTIMVPVSALKGEGIQQLLDMVLLLADMENLRANPNRGAIGTVIEAHLDQSLGPIATVIINTGTLKVMDNVVIGSTYGRVKVMKDAAGKSMKFAPPSTPVLIAGLAETPFSGDILRVTADEHAARSQALNVKTLKDAALLEKRGVGEIISQISSKQLKQLKLVLKADTKGSLEALKQSLAQIKNEDVGVKIILSGVGAINESDVLMAAAANGIVMGFHVEANLNVKRLADRERVEVLNYTIIYKLLDDVKKILTGLLEPEMIENILGRAQVKMVFMTGKKDMVVGCKVLKGYIENKVKLRVFRKDLLVGEGQIISLRHGEKPVHEIADGNECGMRYEGFMPLMEGDELEAYKIEKRIRTL
ncbi:MAG: translation initiation factor IF-2 [Candidatus Gracilibacteria bacterium]|jgi:translation initiation factor IF-2